MIQTEPPCMGVWGCVDISKIHQIMKIFFKMKTEYPRKEKIQEKK